MSDEKKQVEDQIVDRNEEEGDDFEGHQLEGEKAESEDEPDFEGHQLEDQIVDQLED